MFTPKTKTMKIKCIVCKTVQIREVSNMARSKPKLCNFGNCEEIWKSRRQKIAKKKLAKS
jgi:hypothetical protein